MTKQTQRVAVITGGASGIGLGAAKALAADGHKVALLDRAGADAAAKELEADGATVLGIEVDVADRAGVEQAFAQIRAELGPVGILVTSAGIESFQPLLEITPESWDRIISVNLTGTFTCVQAAVPDMLDGGLGPHRHDLVAERPVGRAEHGALLGVEGRRDLAHPGAVGGAGPPGHHRPTRSHRAWSTPRWPATPWRAATSPAST